MEKFYIIMMTALFMAMPLSAQTDKKDVRAGNRDFRKENYKDAEIDYRKALVKDSLSVAANYNLANTLYRQGDMEQAAKALETIKEVAPSSGASADYYFNMGDVALACQDYQTAVTAFAQSLLRNPSDLNAKENFIYARMKLQEQQQNQQNQQDQQNQDQQDGQNQQDQQNQNQDQQDGNDNQDNKDNQDSQNDDNQDKSDENKQQPQQNQSGQQPKITPQAAQQMLQAIQAKEKETQDKVNKQKAEALKSRQKDKNW